MLSSEFYEVSKNTFFYRTPSVAAFKLITKGFRSIANKTFVFKIPLLSCRCCCYWFHFLTGFLLCCVMFWFFSVIRAIVACRGVSGTPYTSKMVGKKWLSITEKGSTVDVFGSLKKKTSRFILVFCRVEVHFCDRKYLL